MQHTVEEFTTSRTAPEDLVHDAFPAYFPRFKTSGNPGAEFYSKFQREAEHYDHDFTRKYDEDLNIVLIFAGLFSVVTAIFIAAIQNKLQPDYTQLGYAVLTVIASTSLGHPPADLSSAIPNWTGPDSRTVRVQSVLYSSLATSLLAAFIAMLGKQWLDRYSQAEVRGSAIDRSRLRQRKLNGMVAWRFDLVVRFLPLMLQAALLLLGYALSDYLFTISSTIAGVVIAFTAFGLLFYFVIVSAATLSYDCPFQTPVSLAIRGVLRLDDDNKGHFRRFKVWYSSVFPFSRRMSRRRDSIAHDFQDFKSFDRSFGNHIRLAMTSPTDQQTPLFNVETAWRDVMLDSRCIAWMFDMSMDADAILAIVKFIPEIAWHSGAQTIPLERVYDVMLDCFDRSSGRPVVIPQLRDTAYFSAKALLHLAIQRQYIGSQRDEAALQSISHRHLAMGSVHYKGDSDLESVLGIVDLVFRRGPSEPLRWHEFSFTVPHHLWMCNTLLLLTQSVLREGKPLPNDVREFVLHSLRLVPPPPAPIISGCLSIIGLLLGIDPSIDDQQTVDKSFFHPQIDRIYTKLVEVFRDTDSTSREIDDALAVMSLIVPLSEESIATRSYDLFHVVMQTPIGFTYTEEEKWQAARLALHGAYKWDKVMPQVGDPKDILTFLDHHFELVTWSGENPDEPIQDALRALAYASDSVTIEALQDSDPTRSSFVRGIRYVFQVTKPFEFRKAAFFFLPVISDKWFNAPSPIMTPSEMESFCVDWASVVDAVQPTYHVRRAALTVLLDMINSTHWRPHVPPEKWKLLEYFTSIPDDSPALRRCLANPGLMDTVLATKNPVAMLLWLTVLWVYYGDLVPEVRRQLEIATREVARGKGKRDVDMYLSVVESEREKAEVALTQYTTWSVDPAATALRRKVEGLREAKHSLARYINWSPPDPQDLLSSPSSNDLA